VSNVIDGPGAVRNIRGRFVAGNSCSPGRPRNPETVLKAVLKVAKQNLIEQGRASENDIMAMMIGIALDGKQPAGVRLLAGREVLNRCRGLPVGADQMAQGDPVRAELALEIVEKLQRTLTARRLPDQHGPADDRVRRLEYTKPDGKPFAASE
jgi:hypothetical protein